MSKEEVPERVPPPTAEELGAIAAEVVKEDALESAPLDKDEQEVYDKVCEHIGKEMTEHFPHETIVRYVRGYEFEKENGGKEKWLEVSCQEIDKTIKWRKEVDADTLMTRKMEKQEMFDKSWGTGVYGVDHQGHPIICESLDDIDTKMLLDNFDVDELCCYSARNVEFVQLGKKHISEATGKLIYKHDYMMDLKGLSRAHIHGRDHMKAIFHVGQYYYPESMYKMFLVNAPFIFRMIWGIIKPWIHPITREKIHLLGGDYMGELEKNGIDSDQIPAFLGGTYDKKMMEKKSKSVDN